MIFLNTQKLIDSLTGKNKAFISRNDKIQREKYGNTDVFECWIEPEENEITMDFGENRITFYFRNGKIWDTIGNGQGHAKSKGMESCAIELASKYLKNNEQEYYSTMINEARLNKIVNESIKKVLKEEEEKSQAHKDAWAKFKKAKAAANGDAKKLSAAHGELEKDLRAAGELHDFRIADETGPRHGTASSTKNRAKKGSEKNPNPDHDGRFMKPKKGEK